MSKIYLSILIIMILIGLVVQPQFGYTSVQSDIDKELLRIKQQEVAANKKLSDAEKLTNALKVQKTQEVKNMDLLLKEIKEQGVKLNELNKQLNNVELILLDTGEQLEDAGDRVTLRDQVLKSRLRLMYMNGTVSYLDVLFSATNFSDFLDRFFILKNIVAQDKEVLEANKKDRALVVIKQKEVEDQLAAVKSLSAVAVDVKQKLSLEEKQKEVVIKALSVKATEVEEINDEAEQEIIALAKQRSELNRKKAEAEAKARAKAQAEARAKAEAKARAEAKAKGKAVPKLNSGANSPIVVTPALVYGGGKLSWPVPGMNKINSAFGNRIDPIKKINKLHKGIDIPAPSGATIVAAESGIVLISSWVSGYGNTIVIDHGSGLWTWYAHIKEGGLKVNEGKSVKRNQKIAEVGMTGDSTGNHLHFEVRLNEVAVNPLSYLK